VLARNPGYDGRLRAAIVLASTGDAEEASEAEEMARALAAAQPEHTLINAVLVPIVKASAALGCEQPDRAIDALQDVSRYERGFIAAFAPIHLRGQAYLMLREGRRAAAEFARILEHRGTDPFSPFHACAPLGLARAYHLIGDIAASLREYERFFANWTQADCGVPILVEARAEYDQLERIASEGAEAAAAEG
jgi:eukaryotic-like serine/threonine-protein kinase